MRLLILVLIFFLACTVTFAFTCGNNLTEQGEACDGTDVSGLTCATAVAGFVSGNISCNPDCKSYNLSQCVKGNTINVTNTSGNPSCEQEDVQRAINNANSGDTVLLPEGQCSWTQGVETTKGLIIRGAGAKKTIITNSIPGYGSYSNPLFTLSEGTNNYPRRITQIGMKSNTITNSISSKQGIGVMAKGYPSLKQIDNCEFNDLSVGIFVANSNGLSKNNYYYNVAGTLRHAGHGNDQQYSWDNFRPVKFGSLNYFIHEDEMIELTSDSFVTDEVEGNTYIVRNSKIILREAHGPYIAAQNFPLFDSHGDNPASKQYAAISTLIYDNNIIINEGAQMGFVQLRGGAALIFNNNVDSNGGSGSASTIIREERYQYGLCGVREPLQQGVSCWPAWSDNQYEDAVHDAYIWNNKYNGVVQEPRKEEYSSALIISLNPQTNPDANAWTSAPNPLIIPPYPHPLATGCIEASDCKDKECYSKNCTNNSCTYSISIDGTSCSDDGVECTKTEKCYSGKCIPTIFDNTSCPDTPAGCTKTCALNGCNYTNCNITNGLIRWYKSDETITAGTIKDSSLLQTNGTCSSCPSLTTGKIGNSYEYNGTTNKASITDGTQLNDLCTNGCTFSAWIYPRKQYIPLTGRFSNGSKNNFFIMLNEIDNKLRFSIDYDGKWNNTCSAYSQDYSIKLNEWQHIAAEYDKNYVKIFIDGKKVNSTKCSFADLNSTAWLSAQPIYLAQHSGANYFDGKIDDFRIYNRALTEAEIAGLYLYDGNTQTQNQICTAYPTERYSTAQIWMEVTKWTSGQITLQELIRKVKLWKYCPQPY